MAFPRRKETASPSMVTYRSWRFPELMTLIMDILQFQSTKVIVNNRNKFFEVFFQKKEEEQCNSQAYIAN